MRRTSILTILCLLVLRLAIGWHFLQEGLHKVASWGYLSPRVWFPSWDPRTWFQSPSTPPEKPFSSDVYLRESTGPLGPYFREHIEDPDQRALALLTAKPAPADADPLRVLPQDRVPDALNAEWDAYYERFVAHYNLNAQDKQDAAARLRQSKAQVGLWLTATPETVTVETPLIGSPFLASVILGSQPVSGAPLVKKPYKTGSLEITQTTSQRLADYKAKLDEIGTLKQGRQTEMGRVVDQPALAAARTDAVRMRKELLDDLDIFTKSMKDALGAIIKDRFADFPFRHQDETDPYVALSASLADVGDDGLPTKLSGKWVEYGKLVATAYGLDDKRKEQVNGKLQEAKKKTADWFAEDGTRERIAKYETAVKEFRAVKAEDTGFFDGLRRWAQAEAARRSLQADLNRQNDNMKRTVAAALTPTENAGGVPEPEKKWYTKVLGRADLTTALGWIDLLTVLGVTMIGACLLLGLFTRLNCILGAGFLLMTYLTYPPFPWLAQPPNTEGNPIYVNKNLIELAALLVLATTASGQWLGLDALLRWYFVDRRKGKKNPVAKPETQSNGAPREARNVGVK
jgi:uncharacterized membrane protein YphA (DoxX/SURF4 family)